MKNREGPTQWDDPTMEVPDFKLIIQIRKPNEHLSLNMWPFHINNPHICFKSKHVLYYPYC